MNPRTLNMRMNEPHRDPTKANLGFQRFSKQRQKERKADSELYVQLQELSVIGDDLPVCFVCHGRSLTWDGHPACTGRRVA